MELDELMKDCIHDANERYPDLDWSECIHEAVTVYTNVRGGPIEFETQEDAEDYLMKCGMYLVSLVIGKLEDEGLVEMVGVDENGEFYYALAQPT